MGVLEKAIEFIILKKSEIKNLIPMKKMSKPEYIFGVLKFLAEDESNFITGQNILVDGGKTII